jgi:pilus assembly protein CpaE
LELELGDAARTLGVAPKFSIMDGMSEIGRLDAEFFTALLTQHRSGLAVLAGPDQVTTASVPKSAVMKIIGLAKEQFSYVVVDAGSHPGEVQEALFEAANAVYLVTQVSVPDLRNAHRIIKRFFRDNPDQVQIVVNRFQTRGLEIDEAAITKALTCPVSWKIPNDYAAARKAQNTGIAMASEELPIARVFADMARQASGQIPAQQKRRKFGLFS